LGSLSYLVWEKYEQAREGKNTRQKSFLQRMGDAQGRLLDSITGLDQATLCNESVAGDWTGMDILGHSVSYNF